MLRTLIKLNMLAMDQGERACIRGSEYILLEILDVWPQNPPATQTAQLNGLDCDETDLILIITNSHSKINGPIECNL